MEGGSEGPADRPDDLGSDLGTTWWKIKTDVQKLFLPKSTPHPQQNK